MYNIFLKQKLAYFSWRKETWHLLGNMISNEGMRENSNNICIDDKVNITNEWIHPLMGWLQLYILLVLLEAILYL